MVHKVPEGWLTEGDLIFASEEELRLYYRYLHAQPGASPTSPTYRALVKCIAQDGNPYEGLDQTWNVHRKLNLTYCFGAFIDSNLEAQVRASFDSATHYWERVADVNFIHIDIPPEQCLCGLEKNPDLATCPEGSYQAKIRVRQGRDGANNPEESECMDLDTDGVEDCYDGIADYPDVPDFNPSDPKEFGSLVRIWSSALESESGLLGVLIHELGHKLGLAHEFSRWSHSDGDCLINAESAWRTVTDPDNKSVMGYSYCHDTFDKGSKPSPKDRQGLSYLYNLPRYTRTRLVDAATDDIIWYRPGHPDYEVWQTTPNANGPVIFAKNAFCYSQNCTDPAPEHIRPFPLKAGPNHQGALLYGLEDVADRLLDHTTVVEPIAADRFGTFDLPLVGRFQGPDFWEEIWWVRPGTQTDPLWKFNGNTFDEIPNFGLGNGASGYFRPLVGRWAPQLGPAGSQVLWYREDSPFWRLVHLNPDLATSTETSFGSCMGVGRPLVPDQEYTPLTGNFDQDPDTEIFWASATNSPSVLFHDPSALAGLPLPIPTPLQCSGATTTFPWSSAEFKPFVGDFNGDGKDDIFFYRTGGASNDDVLWLGNNATNFVTQSMNQVDDYSPLVGDYNGDGCDDILWFAPHTTYRVESLDPDPTAGEETATVVQGFSPLWRSVCNLDGKLTPSSFAGFLDDRPQSVPIDSYPVGYNPRVGRWAQ